MKEFIRLTVAFALMIGGGMLMGYGIGVSDSEAEFKRGVHLGELVGRADTLCEILNGTTSEKREEQAEEQTLAA